MDYQTALRASKIVNEIELNNKDILGLEKAINNGIIAAQIIIKSKDDDIYKTTVFENDRIDLLVQVLNLRNKQLTEKLREL